MAWTFCTSGAAIAKAGANANSTITASGTQLAIWSEDAEATMCAISRIDLVTGYASLTANGKQILSDATSSFIAINLINYDMSGYTSRYEAETMMDVLRDSALRGMSLIKDQNVNKYLGAY